MIHLTLFDGFTFQNRHSKGSELDDPFGTVSLTKPEQDRSNEFLLEIREDSGINLYHRTSPSINDAYLCFCGHYCFIGHWNRIWYSDLKEKRRYRCCRCLEWESDEVCGMCELR